jgi:hypothetical protein
MEEHGPQPISRRENRARQKRVEAIARPLGFVGPVEYRHAYSTSGGAQYLLGATPEEDMLLVFAEAFRRDAAADDFSLEAIIAHERGHQLLYRHELLRRNLPRELSTITEEVLASLLGSLIVKDHRDRENLVLKGLAELVESGMGAAEASERVANVLLYLEAIL